MVGGLLVRVSVDPENNLTRGGLVEVVYLDKR
jgi:hypothetical protein